MRAGLVETDKNRKRAITIEVTDKGWAWAAENLDAELPSRSTAAGPIMQAFLSHLKIFLKSRNIALAEIFMIEEAEGLAETCPSLGDKEIKKLIRETYFSLTHGKSKQRVRLHQLRDSLPDIDRNLLDDTLLEMEREEDLVLYTLDNVREITAYDRAAALNTGFGEPRYIIYLGA